MHAQGFFFISSPAFSLEQIDVWGGSVVTLTPDGFKTMRWQSSIHIKVSDQPRVGDGDSEGMHLVYNVYPTVAEFTLPYNGRNVVNHMDIL